MIIFEKLRYKNFLSTGDKFTEINLTDSKSTLVVGQNGAGKSTMLDALSFALFGKSHRSINKPQLVNSINQKKMVVEVEFRVHKKSFKVVRGLKPVVFEIWSEGTLVNQNSHSKEYQKVLEQNILKLNHKSFHQVVVLGSSSFVPFMQLPAHTRREVIEDLLDINVFSKMNQLLRERAASLKEQINQNLHALDINETKMDAQKKYIRDVMKINKEYRQGKLESIKSNNAEIDLLVSENLEMQKEVDALNHEHHFKVTQELSQKISKLQKFEVEFKAQMKPVVKEAKFFSENENCPTCEQEIDEQLKKDKMSAAQDRAKKLQEGIAEVQTNIKEAEGKLSESNTVIEQIQTLNSEMTINNQQINNLNAANDKVREEIDSLADSDGDLSVANTDYHTLQEEREELSNKKYELNEQQNYNHVVGELLKDTGIKTKIIKQYLPVMNKLVNSYLQVLDFYVHFDLDESFNETIRSRHRDDFSYASFSEGEKQRIDLALLFTWRQIAKMKNSVSTNLLMLDETFDSSLDVEGVDNLLKILDTLGDDTNIFVISHKGDLLEGKFDKKLQFSKEKNFSKMQVF